MADASQLSAHLDAQRQAFDAERYPTLAVRRDRLRRLGAMTREHRQDIIKAIRQDFGYRPEAETRLLDIARVLQAVRHARRHLKRWMRPSRATVPWRLWPARVRVHRQPLGTVGIIAPSHSPWSLALLPAVDALAAGNRVMIKPSERSPTTSALMARLAEHYFSPQELNVITGDADTGRAFAALPFDHLLFTGDDRAGREVALAAAANLTPVTLELGGKTPVIIGADADLEQAAERLAFGKWLNAGQTRLAPDYVLVHEPHLAAFVAALTQVVKRFHPSGPAGEDYSAIVGESHRERLDAMLEEARDHGCRVIPLGETVELSRGAKLPPTLVIDPHGELAIMREEIFGPWLPIIGIGDLDHALAFVHERPRPLALYAFTNDPEQRRRILEDTHSGGVVFNDTLWHNAVPNLPFGGVGGSGMGGYQGGAGFLRFSHQRSVFLQARRSSVRLLNPPYRHWLYRLMGF